MKKKIIFKLFSFISAFSILFNSFYAPLYVLAQDSGDQSTPSATPTAEPTQTPDPDSSPELPSTLEPTSTPEATSTTEPSAPPTTAPTAEPTPTLPPSPEVVLGEVTESSPTPTVVADTTSNEEVGGEIEVFVLENTSAQSVEETELPSLDYRDVTSATLVTDKFDYAPTDTVVIAGSGFAPNTTYELVITSETGNFRFSDTVTSDGSGTSFTLTNLMAFTGRIIRLR